jgi:hypothetical protein
MHCFSNVICFRLTIQPKFGTGNMAAYEVHNSAITAIVSLRGGLEHLGMKGVLAHVLKRYVASLIIEMNTKHSAVLTSFCSHSNLAKSKIILRDEHDIPANASAGQSCDEQSLGRLERRNILPADAAAHLPSYYELVLLQYQNE